MIKAAAGDEKLLDRLADDQFRLLDSPPCRCEWSLHFAELIAETCSQRLQRTQFMSQSLESLQWRHSAEAPSSLQFGLARVGWPRFDSMREGDGCSHA